MKKRMILIAGLVLISLTIFGYVQPAKAHSWGFSVWPFGFGIHVGPGYHGYPYPAYPYGYGYYPYGYRYPYYGYGYRYPYYGYGYPRYYGHAPYWGGHYGHHH